MLRPASNPVELSLWDCTCRWRRRHKGSHEYHFWVIWPTQSLNDSERRTRMFFHANQASCYMLLWRKHGYRTEENLESHGVQFAEAKGFAKSQDTYYRAHYWDLLVEVWILDSFESRSHRHCTEQRLQVSFSSIIAASTGYLLICLLRHEDPTQFFSSSAANGTLQSAQRIIIWRINLWGQGEQRNKLILHFKQVSDCKWTN